MIIIFWVKNLFQQILKKLGYQLTRSLPESDIKDQILTNFRENSKGILHIGAHYAEEANEYFALKKPVLWIEGDPEIYETLEKNISKFPMQQSICALLGEKDLSEIRFHQASNEGSSSSIYELVQNHGFSNLRIKKTMLLPMVRLDSLIKQSDLEKFDHWVIDVQGAELKVLQGAGNLIELANSILVEASNRPIYAGGVSYRELDNFLKNHNFMRLWNLGFKEHSNLLYVRNLKN